MRLTSGRSAFRVPSTALEPRSGYVLLAVLMVIVVLSLAAYQFTEVMSSEYRAAYRTTDATQARLAAVSGLHFAAGMLADRDSLSSQLNGNPYDAPGVFSDVVAHPFPDNPRREARFALVTVYNNNGSYETRYGVADEGGRLNINSLIQIDNTGQVLHDALMKLPNMTEEIADAIVDWVDADEDPRVNGAEASYYGALPNPYKPKNGPLNSLDELLLVRGVTPQLLYGNDRNRNGIADDVPDGSQTLDRGWAEFLTVYGRELNTDTTGAIRLNLTASDDLPGLFSKLVPAVGEELAAFIMAYKLYGASSTATTTTSVTTNASGTTMSVTVTGTGGTQAGGTGNTGGTGSTGSTTKQGEVTDLVTAVTTTLGSSPTNKKQPKSVLDFRNVRVTLPKPMDAPPETPTLYYDSPLNDPAKLAQYLPILLDKTSASGDVEMIPRVNVNTATREVLTALPNMPAEAVETILAARDNQSPTDVATLTGAWVVTTNAVPADTFKSLEKYITGRTMVYRLQAIGYFGQGGPVARVEAVVDINQGAPRFLYFRDMTELDSPRGFEPPRR